MSQEDELALHEFARFLLTHTVVQVEVKRADEWQRLFARAAMEATTTGAGIGQHESTVVRHDKMRASTAQR
jgi:hypothetical protein